MNYLESKTSVFKYSLFFYFLLFIFFFLFSFDFNSKEEKKKTLIKPTISLEKIKIIKPEKKTKEDNKTIGKKIINKKKHSPKKNQIKNLFKNVKTQKKKPKKTTNNLKKRIKKIISKKSLNNSKKQKSKMYNNNRSDIESIVNYIYSNWELDKNLLYFKKEIIKVKVEIVGKKMLKYKIIQKSQNEKLNISIRNTFDKLKKELKNINKNNKDLTFIVEFNPQIIY